MDGVKYLDHEVQGEFSGKISAFTYPDELEDLQGVGQFAPGVSVYDQPSKTFGLSYRTTLGDDISADAGHRIHVLYNLRAVPDDTSYATQGSDVSPVQFGWTITSTPPAVFGIRPTAHISFNTRKMAPADVAAVEAALYGTALADAQLPSMTELLALV
jgi:hypothetical protein